jgi:DNA-3-methyladenine glycosylase I
MPKTRCEWAKTDLSIAYHDEEWGVPLHDDRKLFEFLILEGAQAGLSWETILQKREAYREVFDGFDPEKVMHYDDAKIARLLEDSRIIRNRLKIRSAAANAGAFVDVQALFGSFDRYLWDFVDGETVRNRWKSLDQIPATSPASRALSRDLKQRGFRFVGPTICYAFMQAVGMVNDHVVSCFRYKELS